MKTALREGERLLHEGPANIHRGIEGVGGKLYLTDQRLIFESHAFNIQKGATEIALEAIEAARPSWTRLLMLIPVAPNGLEITVEGGQVHRLTVYKRKLWVARIDEARGV